MKSTLAGCFTDMLNIKLNKSMRKIFVGWDSREPIAYEVCKYSIQKHSPTAMVNPLKQDLMRELGLYWRPIDTKASTEFTFTRFFVPHLSGFKGWSFFVDCDFLFLADPGMLIETFDQSKAAYVCKHPGYIPNSQIKMDGIPQHRAFRKNWASFIAFNNSHPSNAILTPEYLNNLSLIHI